MFRLVDLVTAFLLCMPSSFHSKIEHSAVFSNGENPISLDIGSQKVASTCELSLKITNATGRSLDLNLSPSCGCTELSTKKISLKIDEEFVFTFTIKVPQVEERLGLFLLFKDAMSSESFKVEIHGKAVPIFASKQKTAIFEKGNSWESTVELLENFQDEVLDEVLLLNDSAFELVHRDGKFLKFRSLRPGSNFIEEPIVLIVRSKSSKETALTIPVDFFGTPKLSPSLIRLRKEGDLYRAVFLVSGIEAPKNNSLVSVVIEDVGRTELKGRVEKLQNRTERTYLIIASFASEEIEKLPLNSELKVRVSCEESGWTCSTKLWNFRY